MKHSFQIFHAGNLLSVALLLMLSMSVPVTAAETWHQIGPAGPGNFNSVAIDQQDSLTLYAASPDTGIFKSVDGGENWQLLVQSPKGGGRLQIHPAGILYFEQTTPKDLFRSGDGGAHWTSIQPTETDPFYQAIALEKLTLDPLSAQTLFAVEGKLHGWWNEPGGGVSRSLDGGSSWHPVHAGLPQSESGLLIEVTALAIDPLDPLVLYAGVQDLFSALPDPSLGRQRILYRSVDGGESWQELATFIHIVRQIVIDPYDTATIFVTSGEVGNNHFDRSRDSGYTWEHRNPPQRGGLIDIIMDPNNPDTIISPDGLHWRPRLWKTRDQGDHWVSYDPPVNLRSLTFDADTSLLYAATSEVGHGLFRSLDEGETWDPFGQGVQDKVVNQIRVGPEGSTSLYASERGGMIYHSPDSGRSWIPMEQLKTGTGVTQNVTSLTVDKATPAIYAVAKVATPDPHSGYPWVYVSADEGQSWNQLGFTGISGLDFHPSKILVDPWDPSRLYMGAVNPISGRLFRSSDGGQNWESVLTFGNGNMVPVIDPVNPSILYVGNSSSYSFTGDSLMKSTDGGDTWAPHSDGLPLLDAEKIGTPVLAIDTVHPTNLLAATERGIYKSTDGAGFWWRVDNNWPDGLVASDLLIDPLIPSTIYAVGGDLGIFRSLDGGFTWIAFNDGLTVGPVLSLDLDTFSRALFAGTGGGGVFTRFLEDDALEVSAIFADPNPIRVCGDTASAASISWYTTAVPKTQVRVGAADGPLFGAGLAQGQQATGNWIHDGMAFYLLERNSGEILAQTQVRMTDSGCETLLAEPNPIRVCESSVGVTTLRWFTSAMIGAEVHVNSPTGPLMARKGPTGTAQTGNWVRDGMQFFLTDRSTQAVLGQLEVSHTQAGCPN